MAAFGWDHFDWDDENKKNGNVQHLRDHDIEPEEARNVFFTIMLSRGTTAVLTTCILSMEELIVAEG